MITLSGGPAGGLEVDSTGWNVGEIRTFDGCNYRLDIDGVVFVGMA